MDRDRPGIARRLQPACVKRGSGATARLRVQLAPILLGLCLLVAPLVQAQPPAMAPLATADDRDPPQPELLALIREPALREISGLAASRRHPGMLWVHNDSGYGAELHAIDRRGRRRATLRLEGVEAIDWEDLAAFTLDGRRYLLVADTGDNGGRRSELVVHVVEEPAELVDAEVKPAWSQRLRWPDGPRDVEAVAVDSAAREILFIAKKRVPPQLLSLPLGPQRGVAPARVRASLAGITPPSPAELAGNARFGRYRAQITAADLSADGLRLAVLNYRRAHVYTRSTGEDWASALAREPHELSFGWVAQAEAIAFEPDGDALLLSGERLPAPLIRLPLAPAD
jgi:hypothetical protein